MSDTYKTILDISEGIFKDRGSKFLSFAYPVTDEVEIKTILKDKEKKYHDARHICYAYRLGFEDFRYRVNDNGEPSGTAGQPIYRQILSHEITNVLIVVVRYFGGTLLGKPGLIKAYQAAAVDCLEKTRIIERSIEKIINLRYGYELTTAVMKLINDQKIRIIHQSFDDDCTIKLGIVRSYYDSFSKKINTIKGLTISDETFIIKGFNSKG